MKKKVLYLFVLVCSLGLFTACNKEDDKLDPIGDNITGVFLGELKISLDGEKPSADADAIPQKVYITKTGDNTVEMQLKNFSFGGLKLGTIKVDRCDATKEGDSYRFTGAQTMELDVVGNCDVTLSGVITGDKIEMDIDVVATMGTTVLNVRVVFAGDKLSVDLSSEANMLTFAFESNLVMGTPVISHSEGTITFHVSKEITEEGLSALAPQFTVSPGATVSPASGEPQNFANGNVITYIVTSQDKVVVNTYRTSVKGEVYHYAFETWGTVGTGTNEYAKVLNADWDSSNDAITLLKTLGFYAKDASFPIVSAEGGKIGTAASITTLDTKGSGLFKIPRISAGTLFTGVFKTNASAPLKSTQFGIPFTAKPKALKGFYKYTPGADYYQVGKTIDKATIDVDKSDEYSIIAVLFEAEGDYVLDGSTLNDLSQDVLRVELFGGDTAGEWKEFNIPFTAEGSFVYDASKSYKLAIVCSSSKHGATYSGAPGSVLMIDEFEVVID